MDCRGSATRAAKRHSPRCLKHARRPDGKSVNWEEVGWPLSGIRLALGRKQSFVVAKAQPTIDELV